MFKAIEKGRENSNVVKRLKDNKIILEGQPQDIDFYKLSNFLLSERKISTIATFKLFLGKFETLLRDKAFQ